jgi:hypothetical protein
MHVVLWYCDTHGEDVFDRLVFHGTLEQCQAYVAKRREPRPYSVNRDPRPDYNDYHQIFELLPGGRATRIESEYPKGYWATSEVYGSEDVIMDDINKTET